MPDTISLNLTNQVVREAVKIVSRDVRAPKAVRDGIVVKTVVSTQQVK